MSQILKPEEVDFQSYRMPAEWAPHEATWLAWPHNLETWPNVGQLEEVRKIWARMIEALCPHEKVCVLVNDDAMEEQARGDTAHIRVGAGNIEFIRIPSDDAWMRDSGPNFLLPAKEDAPYPVLIQDFVFNSWGKKYDRGTQMIRFPLVQPKSWDFPVCSMTLCWRVDPSK